VKVCDKTCIFFSFPITNKCPSYIVRKLSHVSGRDAIKSAYFTYSHSKIRYGIIFHGNPTNANRVFFLQKRVIRILWK